MKKRLVSILALVLVMITCFSVGVMASGTLQEIKAYLNYGVTIEYNDVDQVMYDAGGNRVYPITYNGTTYLPVRAVCNMLGIKVDWDQATQHVLLGNSFVDTQTPTTTDLFDFTFISEALTLHGNGKIGLSEHSQKYVTADGIWKAEDYSTSSSPAYSFPSLSFVASDLGSHPEIKAMEDYICKALEARGYTLAKIDEWGAHHYVKGVVEFQVWNVAGNNSNLQLSAKTHFLGCCVKN